MTGIMLILTFSMGMAEAGEVQMTKKMRVPEDGTPLHTLSDARMERTMDPKTTVGKIIAWTTYDFFMNRSQREMISVHTMSGGFPDYVHFGYVKRTGTPLPDDRHARYVVYDVLWDSVITDCSIIPFTTRLTYFPSVGVFQGGPANGLVAFAVNATSSTQPMVIAINTTPNQCDFTVYNAAGVGRDANIQIDHANQIIFVSDNHLRGGIRASMSSDYGPTWSNVDVWRTTMGADTAVYTISGNATLDFPTMIAPNGAYAIVANMNGVGGALPPIGTGTEANASGTFVFTSTDRGATWTKTKIWSDGRMMQGPGGVTDTDYVLLYGWGVQVGGMFDANSNVHLVFNGTSFHSNGDGTYSLVAQILHWSQATGMKRISDPAISHYPLWDSMNAGNPPAPTNQENLSFPQICASPTSDVLFAVWNQPSGITPTFCDTAYGHAKLDIWGASSHDGGVTWSAPFRVVDAAPRGSVRQPLLNRWMTSGNVAHMMFIDDTANGVSLFTGTNVVPIPIRYYAFTVPVDVKEPTAVVPAAFHLGQNYPNPFNPTTEISYQIPSWGRVTLKVFNILGQEVATLVDETKLAGTYAASFNGSRLPSGVYYYQLNAGGFFQTRKMLLLK